MALLAHDIGHYQVFRNHKVNLTAGIFVGDGLLGASRRWWVEKHEDHHDNPNDIDLDPDVNFPFLIFDVRQFSSRPGWLKPLIMLQGVIFFLLLPFQAVNVVFQSLRFLIGKRGEMWRLEVGAILAHLVVYSSLLYLQFSFWQVVVFVVIHRGLFGVLNSVLFANNHKGQQMITQADRLHTLTKQVITARDTVCPAWLNWFFGGLNFQIPHHLFRGMPRNNLHRAQKIVEEICAQIHDQDLKYTKETLIQSYLSAFGHVISMPQRLRQTA
jgi:fatty acid desaturase